MTGPDLELAVSGQVLRFPAVWLRDNCPCPECVASGTTQKLRDITDLPNGVAVTHTEHAGDSVTVTFAPDQHRATFSRSWLTARAPGAGGDGDERTEDGKRLWLRRGPGARAGSRRRTGPATSVEPAERIRALEAVLRLGFVAAPRCAARAGYRARRRGGLRVMSGRPTTADCSTSASRPTPRQSRLHGPGDRFRTPTTPTEILCPTVQLLHCLGQLPSTGGESGLSAVWLPRGRGCCAQTIPRLFPDPHSHSGDLPLRPQQCRSSVASRPIIGLTPTRPDSRDPVRTTGRCSRCGCLLHQHRGVLRRLPALRRDPQSTPSSGWSPSGSPPGDCVVFDNTRLLHARTSFC